MKTLVGAALCLTVLEWSAAARADETYLFGNARAQAGLITEARKGRDLLKDVHLDGIPQIGITRATPTSQLSLSYTLTAAAHTAYSSELGHQLHLIDAMDLSQRTNLSLGANASRMTLGNMFLTQPASAGTSGLFPATTTTIVSVGANQGLTHDVSPRVRLDEEASATAFKTLYPAPPSKSYYASLGGGLERVWQNDGLGGSVHAGFANAEAPPAPEQSLLVLTAGPRWRRDWSPTINTLFEAGASMVQSVSRSSDPYFAPLARGNLLYTTEDVTLTLLGSTSVSPNPLTGQLVQAHEGSIHAITPLSLPSHIFLEGSVAYTHGKLIDRIEPDKNQDYDTVLADLGLIWELNPYLEAYARYTFVSQTGAAATGQDQSFSRNSVLIGVQVSSRPLITRGGSRTGGLAGQQGPAQRVDRADRPARGAAPAPEPEPPNRNAEPTFVPPRDDD